MLPSFRNHFKVEEHSRESSDKGSLVVGLKILVQISQGKSNIVVKSASTKALPGSKSTEEYSSSFLKSCHLCHKNLSLDKDVYMYRGDQGFCSIECRNRQIYLDDMKKLEKSTKQMLSSHRQCSSDDRRETQRLLKELRQRHYKQPQSGKIQWAIVS